MYPPEDARELAILLPISRELDIVGDVEKSVAALADTISRHGPVGRLVPTAFEGSDLPRGRRGRGPAVVAPKLMPSSA